MSAKTTAVPDQAPPAPAAAPATGYERFISALPEPFRKECQSKLEGSGLAANHPVFRALAELYEKEREKPTRDFLQEATLHADQSTHLLSELKGLPNAIMAKIEPQIVGIVSALNNPLQRLEAIATAIQPLNKTLPPQAPPEPVIEPPPQIPTVLTQDSQPEKKRTQFGQSVGRFLRTAGSTVSNTIAWIVTGAISAALAVMIFSLGAARLAAYSQVWAVTQRT